MLDDDQVKQMIMDSLKFKDIEERLEKTQHEIKRTHMRGIRTLLKCMGVLKRQKDEA